MLDLEGIDISTVKHSHPLSIIENKKDLVHDKLDTTRSSKLIYIFGQQLKLVSVICAQLENGNCCKRITPPPCLEDKKNYSSPQKPKRASRSTASAHNLFNSNDEIQKNQLKRQTDCNESLFPCKKKARHKSDLQSTSQTDETNEIIVESTLLDNSLVYMEEIQLSQPIEFEEPLDIEPIFSLQENYSPSTKVRGRPRKISTNNLLKPEENISNRRTSLRLKSSASLPIKQVQTIKSNTKKQKNSTEPNNTDADVEDDDDDEQLTSSIRNRKFPGDKLTKKKSHHKIKLVVTFNGSSSDDETASALVKSNKLGGGCSQSIKYVDEGNESEEDQSSCLKLKSKILPIRPVRFSLMNGRGSSKTPQIMTTGIMLTDKEKKVVYFLDTRYHLNSNLIAFHY